MTLTKDGNPLYGESNTESKEKTIPRRSLTPKEKEFNTENEWLRKLEGRGDRGQKAINTQRIPTRYVSRGQRGAIVGETDGPESKVRSKAQRKVVKSG